MVKCDNIDIINTDLGQSIMVNLNANLSNQDLAFYNLNRAKKESYFNKK